MEDRLFNHPTNVLRGQIALDTDATAVDVPTAALEELDDAGAEERRRISEADRRMIAQMELDGYL